MDTSGFYCIESSGTFSNCETSEPLGGKENVTRAYVK